MTDEEVLATMKYCLREPCENCHLMSVKDCRQVILESVICMIERRDRRIAELENCNNLLQEGLALIKKNMESCGQDVPQWLDRLHNGG